MGGMPNIVPISELRQDASGIVKRAGAYERTQREIEILHMLAQGEVDIAAGTGYDLDAVMAEVDELLDRS